MDKIREINVFTFGDSSLAKTWSNVPYLLTTTLENKGYIVNRINIIPNRYLQSLYNRILYKLTLYIKKDNVYMYERTYVNFILTNLRIRRFNKEYPNADLNIFTNFSFRNRYSDKPSVLFCDWDLSIGINDRLGRKPYFFEQTAIDRQRSVIEKSDLLISLFPKSAETMRRNYNNPNIYHLNQNVINNLFKDKVIPSQIIENKKKSFDILFIGSINYIEGAKLLIKSVSKLRLRYPLLKVKIIGIKSSEFEQLESFVECYGYLDKSNEQDRKTYYSLIINSRIFVNPTPVWGGYSSTIEAMYFCNPVIISPYEEFVKEFGDTIFFGTYCSEFSDSYLQKCLLNILNDENYAELCNNAHNVVADYTWDKYIDLLMNKISCMSK